MRATVYIATSLDGFIAREDGAIDWLPDPASTGDGDDYGYGAFFDSVDALVLGRNSYEMVRTFGGEWLYGAKPVIVLTTRPLAIPEAIAATVETMAGPPSEIVARLAGRGMEHLYVDGGKTIQGFLAEGLIQRLIITRIPVLIGRGLPLFGPVPVDLHLKHVETRAYPSGLVQSEYQVAPLTPS